MTTCVLLSALLYQNTIRPLARVKLLSKLFLESHGTMVVCRRIAFRIICSSSFPIATPLLCAKVPLSGCALRTPIHRLTLLHLLSQKGRNICIVFVLSHDCPPVDVDTLLPAHRFGL